jgi:hypothetical protein
MLRSQLQDLWLVLAWQHGHWRGWIGWRLDVGRYRRPMLGRLRGVGFGLLRWRKQQDGGCHGDDGGQFRQRVPRRCGRR